MEGDQLISESDKKGLGNQENLEDNSDSILNTTSFPTFKHIAKAAEEELAEIPFESRKILFKDIPLLSRTFSETFTRQFNLPPDEAISHVFKYEKIFTKLAEQQGLLDSSQHRPDQCPSEPSWLYQIPPRPSWPYESPARPSWQYQGPRGPSWLYQDQKPSWQQQGPPIPRWQYQGPRGLCWQYKGPPIPSWQYQGPRGQSWQYKGPTIQNWQYQGPRGPSWQYKGPPIPGWQYQGPRGPSWQYQSPSLPEEVWNHMSTEQKSSADNTSNENKEMGDWCVNSTNKGVSNDLVAANYPYPQSYSAPAGFCCVTPKYIHIHQDEDYFCTPFNANTFSSTASTFANFRTPIHIQHRERYDPVTPLKEIEVEILEADAIEFIHHQNGDYFLVGEGTYGSVYLAQMNNVSHLVCVKGYSAELSPTTAIVHEAKILTYLQDTGLVPEFHGILRLGDYPGDFSLVQEFSSNGITFRDLLKGPENECNNRERIRILHNLASGLKVLHQKEVLWNDLKANNVLVDIENKHRVTFIDFGVASFKSGRRFCITGDTEPFRFLAPEVRGGFATSEASDIYSLGYLMMKSLRNQPISQNLENLMHECLNDDPNDRPSTQKIISILELFV